MPARKLTSEQRLSRAIDIMEALYAAGGTGMTRGDICSRFDITGAALDEIIDIVSTLADRESGARIICERHGECIILTGDAGRVLPLRLSAPKVPCSTTNSNRWESTLGQQSVSDTPSYPRNSATTSASSIPLPEDRTGNS